MVCKDHAWKRSSNLPTGMAPVVNGSNHLPGAVVEGEREPGISTNERHKPCQAVEPPPVRRSALTGGDRLGGEP